MDRAGAYCRCWQNPWGFYRARIILLPRSIAGWETMTTISLLVPMGQFLDPHNVPNAPHSWMVSSCAWNGVMNREGGCIALCNCNGAPFAQGERKRREDGIWFCVWTLHGSKKLFCQLYNSQLVTQCTTHSLDSFFTRRYICCWWPYQFEDYATPQSNVGKTSTDIFKGHNRVFSQHCQRLNALPDLSNKIFN